jgi:hypothetical protein
MKNRPLPALAGLVLLALGAPSVASAAACLLTVDELRTATGREFGAGQEGKAVDGSGLCVYAEAAAPTRKLTVNVIESRGKAAFDSRMRMLTMSKKEIGLKGVGDAAYFNGTAAGVLKGDKLITLSGVRRPSSPAIPQERIAALLQAALGRATK